MLSLSCWPSATSPFTTPCLPSSAPLHLQPPEEVPRNRRSYPPPLDRCSLHPPFPRVCLSALCRARIRVAIGRGSRKASTSAPARVLMPRPGISHSTTATHHATFLPVVTPFVARRHRTALSPTKAAEGASVPNRSCSSLCGKRQHQTVDMIVRIREDCCPCVWGEAQRST